MNWPLKRSILDLGFGLAKIYQNCRDNYMQKNKQYAISRIAQLLFNRLFYWILSLMKLHRVEWILGMEFYHYTIPLIAKHHMYQLQYDILTPQRENLEIINNSSYLKIDPRSLKTHSNVRIYINRLLLNARMYLWTFYQSFFVFSKNCTLTIVLNYL